MDENRSEDLLQPLSASTPVKGLATCINLYDPDSDTSSMETPTKRRRPSESLRVDLNDSNSTFTQPSFCSEDSPVKDSKTGAHREPVWVNIDVSTSSDPLNNTVTFNVQGTN